MTEARAEGGGRASGQVTDEPEIYDYEQAHPGRRPGRSTHNVDDRGATDSNKSESSPESQTYAALKRN